MLNAYENKAMGKVRAIKNGTRGQAQNRPTEAKGLFKD